MSKTSKIPTVSHDSATPANLVSFMLQNWQAKKIKLPKALKNLKQIEQRRSRLSQLFPQDCLVIPTGHLKVRANDTFYSFRPHSDFYYLTGNLEPDCVLLMIPNGKNHDLVLFAEPNPGKTDSTFFTDRVKGELWEGARMGLPESAALYGIPNTCSLVQLETDVIAAIQKAGGQFRLLRSVSPPLEKILSAPTADQLEKDRALAAALSEMRLIKDSGEIKLLAEAVDATQRGFEDVILRMKKANSERELEGVFFTRARMEGNDVGYGSIVASGCNACTLHWKKNNSDLQAGDLLLLDAGIEGHSLYTADITRTLPLSGKFSHEQKIIYELVLAAQKAAHKAVQPGNDFMEPNRKAMEVLAAGLVKMGILTCTLEEALQEENQFYKRYTLHNVSHMLGLDVHDCAQARAETYKFGKLEPGMVLTIEPGLYFQPDDLTVPVRFRGIGVRIEDDVVVTAKGSRNLSQNIPTEVKDIESWIQSVWKRNSLYLSARSL